MTVYYLREADTDQLTWFRNKREAEDARTRAYREHPDNVGWKYDIVLYKMTFKTTKDALIHLLNNFARNGPEAEDTCVKPPPVRHTMISVEGGGWSWQPHEFIQEEVRED